MVYVCHCRMFMFIMVLIIIGPLATTELGTDGWMPELLKLSGPPSECASCLIPPSICARHSLSSIAPIFPFPPYAEGCSSLDHDLEGHEDVLAAPRLHAVWDSPTFPFVCTSSNLPT